jgi:hypothetical protein
MAETSMVRPFEGANTLGRTQSEWPLRRFSQHVLAYTSRTMSYQDEIERAFKGIMNALAPTMANTTIFFGLPSLAFDWALLWSGPPDNFLSRREGFPSWSWMGYQGHIHMAMDHWSEFDQRWLRTRTWVDWHVFQNNHIVPVWNPERDGTEIWSDDEAPETEQEREQSPIESEEAQAEDGTASSEESLARCPTYGQPEDGNLYGRQHPSGVLDFLKAFCSSELRLQHSELPKNPSPRCLYFSTLSCSFGTASATFLEESYEYLARSISFRVLIDRHLEVCGLIKYDLADEADSVSQTAEVLLVSYSAPGSHSSYPIDNLKGQESSTYRKTDHGENEDAEKILGDWHHWKFLNVLVVKTKNVNQHVVERVGVGIIYKAAIAASLIPAQYKSFVLC